MLIDDPYAAAHQYFYYQEREAEAVKKKNECRDYLKDYIRREGEPDENGNIIWYFNTPIDTGKPYYGLKLERRVSEYTDEDIAADIVISKGLRARCIWEETVQHLDLDEIYACNQEGLITDDEIDSMIVVSETFALVKVK